MYQKRTLDATTVADDYLSATHIIELFVAELDRKFSHPRGLVEAKEMLDRRYLTPTRRNDVSLAPVKLHIFLRRMVPRWNEAIRDVATVAFLDAAQSHRNIGTRQQGGPKEGRFVYSGADAKRCIDDHWLIDDPVGRSCIKAAIHAALARLSVLSHFLVLETPTVPSHYRLRFQLYARIASTVYMALRKKAGWPNFSDGGGNIDEGPRKVWAHFLVLLDSRMPKHDDIEEGVLLTNGKDATRAAVPDYSREELLKTATMIEAAAAVGAVPPASTSMRKPRQQQGEGPDGGQGEAESAATAPGQPRPSHATSGPTERVDAGPARTSRPPAAAAAASEPPRAPHGRSRGKRVRAPRRLPSPFPPRRRQRRSGVHAPPPPVGKSLSSSGGERPEDGGDEEGGDTYADDWE